MDTKLKILETSDSSTSVAKPLAKPLAKPQAKLPRVSREEKAKTYLQSKGYTITGEPKQKIKRPPTKWNLDVRDAMKTLREEKGKALLKEGIELAKTKRTNTSGSATNTEGICGGSASGSSSGSASGSATLIDKTSKSQIQQ